MAPRAARVAKSGGDEPGDEAATLLSATWRDTRRAVFERGVLPQFRLRQFLFACQARLLLRLARATEVPCFLFDLAMHGSFRTGRHPNVACQYPRMQASRSCQNLLNPVNDHGVCLASQNLSGWKSPWMGLWAGGLDFPARGVCRP